ncbi:MULTISPECIES: hypothetical protein [unclassified Streptomyces]|uniref:hypothetical protein n=1 Tax=unclassified Streptomyces TaxID=2593676 RepID=UPI000FFE6928|nr:MULTISPECIES: hypothetical protein [unclassified Streptomyces]
MIMRLCTPVSLCLAAAAALLPVATPAPAHAAPGCSPDGRHFPLTTRIHDGPDAYEAGGGYGTWYLDLTNTTHRTCAGIHPVVVLVDNKRALKPTQPRLDFYADGRPHPVRFMATDEDELVGAFDGGLPGFTVGPGRTVSIKVRLALTSDTRPNEVTANAAVVQRHKNDGDWVGESGDYRFRIDSDADRNQDGATSADETPSDGTSTGATPTGTASPGADPGLPFVDELARTGLGTPAGTLAAIAVLLVTAGAVLLALKPRKRR